METKAVAEMLHKVLTDTKLDLGKIDGSDRTPRIADDGDDCWCFSLYEHVDVVNPSHNGRGPGRTMPLGQFEYVVTVQRKWHPFEDGIEAPNT